MEKSANKKEGKRELTPLERKVRNSLIRDLFEFGFTVSNISNIMNLDASTVSRVKEGNG